MPPHRSADRPAPLPDRGTMDELIAQARRLRGGIDAVRHRTVEPTGGTAVGLQQRWHRALCELAAHQLADLDVQLGQLREGPPTPLRSEEVPCAPPPSGSLVGRVGSAEWNLLTDEVTWSAELFEIFGRSADDAPLSLDELPSAMLPEDQATLVAAVTDCLVDGKPMDSELRVVRPDGSVRTVHVLGEPVLDATGDTAAMWAVLRDVHELRRSQHAASETRDSLRRERHLAQAERRLAVELQEAVLPPWRGAPHFPSGGPLTLDLAAHYLPSASSVLIGGGWYDALELSDGATLLTVGDLTGHGVTATSQMAMLLGAVRGMAMAGVAPGPLMGHLNQLLDSAAQPALGSALCCRYEPHSRSLSWAQAAHPAPLLFRDGVGRALPAPGGVLLGATAQAEYGQHTERLRPGDLLVLHTEGLLPREPYPTAAAEHAAATPTEDPDPAGPAVTAEAGAGHAGSGVARLLALAPRFAAARTTQECLRAVAEEFGDRDREDDACVLIAHVND